MVAESSKQVCQQPCTARVRVATPLKEGETVIATVIFDNNPFDPRLQTGWGFAAWLEYGDRTILFDTGGNGTVLLSNMAALSLDPQTVDILVLSHIHGDHTGGLSFLSLNRKVAVYMPQALPGGFKNQVRSSGAQVLEVSDPVEILPGLWSTGQMGTSLVEQALVAKSEAGLVMVTGCAHPGIDKMVAQAKKTGRDRVALVVGGFHLGAASRRHIERIISEFQRVGVQTVAPCHCTGDKARGLFRQAYGEDFFACGVGWRWQDGTTE
jgi:7,8-dihydropterin-6-yl-methyl-4-(beta-D-ribofuranosyl)aminobenzene 5'-phosphate synthase